MVDGEYGGSRERRSKPRTLVSVPLVLYYGRERRMMIRGRTVDLSCAGALVHGAGPIRVGQWVEVEVSRGDDRNPLTLKAEVVRISTPDEHRKQHGVALRFIDVSELDEAIIESIIAAARRY
ncbi:PilZ domain-containing protein [Paraliomyxa miuraensis]|uniref:PilZ domain-containing protein n=1 Tax=Paraliomyxa miuraensis TaxID=376150 RepID=UPI002251BB9A|nr:PilZ domain-containing protein [Paraliomyxa miuraensis]MCX4243154.1 PilZ domain-containing protein [Paraliomyxa miuraensis]